MSNLEEIAKKTQKAITSETEVEDMDDSVIAEFEEETSEEEVESTDEFIDDDDAPVIGFGDDVEKASINQEQETQEKKKDTTPEISDDDLFDAPLEDDDGEDPSITGHDFESVMARLGEIPENLREDAANEILVDMEAYKKNLILKQGFSIGEADEAADHWLAKEIQKKVKSMESRNGSEAVIIEVEKGEDGKLNIPEEAKGKIVKSKVVQLKVVEDATLSEIEIEKVPSSKKLTLLNSLDNALSQYSVPLPLLRDYAQFKGSQTMQLVQAVQYEDATLAEVTQKKASLIYSQLLSGSILKKFDDSGKTIMSFTEFTNKFYFHDMDLALYAILVASSMEEIESQLTCGSCNELFDTKYSIKSLLNLDDISDDFKGIIDDILGHKDDADYLKNFHEENTKAWRVKSPLTNNIYDLECPSIAQAIAVQRHIDAEDQTSVYLGALLMFIKKLYVYNPGTGKYVELGVDEMKDLFEIISRVPQEELDILMKYLSPKIYTPQFVLKTQCGNCGHRMVNNLRVEDMVFLKARDTQMEIR